MEETNTLRQRAKQNEITGSTDHTESSNAAGAAASDATATLALLPLALLLLVKRRKTIHLLNAIFVLTLQVMLLSVYVVIYFGKN